ncbi:uncharacterized protein [Drosophila takahashii]|uniref:uncharacterized protein n=1 Tax=Drosophila takahashii TaxID=29030 RepID=UPI001CF8C5F7|nr:uncharacterized protein LOC108058840 [Drosophila takahashii]
MDITKVKVEMIIMAQQVCKDAELWQKSIQMGQVTLQRVKKINLRLFSTENLLNNAESRSRIQATEKRISNLYLRLQSPLTTMNKILEKLTEIRDNTARMLNRLTLWMDDEIISQHQISPKIMSYQLLEALQFLSQRYDAEWEVKEVVVNDLEKISNANELKLLMDSWRICSHAGGQEFATILCDYYKIVDRSIPLVKAS